MTEHESTVPTTRTQAWQFDQVDVMVIDYLEHTHDLYAARMPQEHTFLFVSDTDTAMTMLEQLPRLAVIVTQGHSRSQVDRILSQGPGNTFGFVSDVVEAGFRGRFLVVSTMLDDTMRQAFPQIAPGRIQLVEKRHFFRHAQRFLTDDLFVSFPARDELWAEWELRLNEGENLSARYVEDALTWLDRLDAAINAADVPEVAGVAERLAVPVPSGATSFPCDCPADEAKSLSWWHGVYHRLVNRAVWETVQAVPGLAAVLRARYQMELEAAPKHWPSYSAVLESYQRRMPQMLEFLRKGGPSQQWFNTVGASPEA